MFIRVIQRFCTGFKERETGCRPKVRIDRQERPKRKNNYEVALYLTPGWDLSFFEGEGVEHTFGRVITLIGVVNKIDTKAVEVTQVRLESSHASSKKSGRMQ